MADCRRMRASSAALAVVLVGLSGCARNTRAEGAVEVPPPPRNDLQDLEITRNAFVQRAESAGLRLENPPQVIEWTRPSLISWRREKNAVAVPKWDELSKEQREALATIAGSEDDAPALFGWLFRWFLIPHELTHALQEGASEPLDHARAEQQANDVATAFWMEQAGGPAQLAALETVVSAAVERLPLPVPEGANEDAWFNDNYDALAAKPVDYGAFQLRFMLKSLSKMHRLSLTELLAQTR
jgi:hypothetical protein